MADQNFNGKVIVITGASSGFGRGTARRFAEPGATVVLAARRDNLLDEVARECEAAGGKATAVPDRRHREVDMMRLAEAAVGDVRRVSTSG